MPSSSLLAQRYRLDHQIAVGGAGEVWQAEDSVLARPVAVKLLRAEFAGHPDTLARFRAEARHAGQLSHPAIAQVYDYGEGDPPDPPFLVMELVDGPSLATVLASGPLPPARVMDVIAHAAAGLAAAHAAGLVHRDIKPANLLLGPGGQVKITDFGIAYVAGAAPVTLTGTVVGTPAYLAPERMSGAPATPAADVYSLGMVGYESLAGALPFTGSAMEVAMAHQQRPLPPLPPAVPVAAASLVAEMTNRAPAARPAAPEVAARASYLRDLLAGSGAGRWPAGPAAVWAYPPAAEPAGRTASRLAASDPVARTASLPTAPDPVARTASLPTARAATLHRQDRHARWPHWRAAATAALVALLVLLGLVLLRSAGGPPAAAGGHPASARSRPPATVELAAGTLIGQPLSVARQRLDRLGLHLRVQWQHSDTEPGTVLAVAPSGLVRAGSTVVVTAAAGQAHGHGDGDGGGGGDGGNGGGQGGNGN
jgi:eukaryotic-like serine/threonine-protein kinase